MNTLKCAVAALCLSAGAIPATADAAVVVTFSQVGANVVANTSGTLSSTGLTDLSYASLAGTLVRGDTPLFFSTPQNVVVKRLSGFVGPAALGSGTALFAAVGTGDVFGFAKGSGEDGSVYVPLNFVSGSTITSSATFTNQTIATLGLTAGRYTYTSAGDTITFQIGAPANAAVPEPATWAMMLLGFSGLGFAMRRKAKVSARIRFA